MNRSFDLFSAKVIQSEFISLLSLAWHRELFSLSEDRMNNPMSAAAPTRSTTVIADKKMAFRVLFWELVIWGSASRS